MQFTTEEEQLMKEDLLLFNPDPEAENPYYSIYQNGKLIGRSNRNAALEQFYKNVKLAPNDKIQGLTIQWDNEDGIWTVDKTGVWKNGVLRKK